MKVILLFFLFVCIFILGIILSKVKIKIKTTQNINENQKRNFKFKIVVYIYLFHIIRALKFTVDSKKNKKMKKRQINFDKDLLRIIRSSNLKVEQIHLDISIDTVSIMITTFLTVIFSTIISSILTLNNKSINSQRCKYKVEPLYQNKNMINLNLDCIITSDFVHISNIVYKLFKKDKGDKNERTSN